MAAVTAYSILSYGSTSGYQGGRGQVQLMNGSTVLGWVRFYDPAMPFPDDTQVAEKIVMNLPAAMFENVIDTLRNENPIEFYFASGRAFLGSAHEPVGDGETAWPPTDIPLSRLPFPYQWRGYNFFTVWRSNPAYFATTMQELNAYPPALMAPEGGYQCNAENPFQWGVVKGLSDEIYGDSNMQHIGQILELGLPAPDQLAQRFADLPLYLAEYGPHIKPAVYGDLGTQLFGNHVTRTGFWNFYDHWADYAAPDGPFDLGPKPPDPTTWLRKWYDPNTTSVCPYPAEQWPQLCPAFTAEELQSFAGLSFYYGPKKPLYGSYFRYPACLNTEGWTLWWKQIIQWIARVGFRVAFIDNTSFGSCWNHECQDGYRAWLATRFTQAEIDRVFTVTTSLLVDHSFEGFWYQDANGVWNTPYSVATSGTLSPDFDSYGGVYSARLDGPGELWMHQFPGAAPPGEAREYSLTIHYKTIGAAAAELRVQQIDPGNSDVVSVALPASALWAEHTERFHVQDIQIRVHFIVGGAGSLLVDEIWLSKVIVQDGEEIIEHPTYKTELASGEYIWNFPGLARTKATSTYWNSVVDDKVDFLRTQARLVNPEFQIFTNSYIPRRGSDYFMIEGQALESETLLQDAGHPPGLYLPAAQGDPPRTLRLDPVTGAPVPVTSDVLCTNIFDYKYTWAHRFPDFFSHVVHEAVTVGSYYVHNVDSAMLLHAEAGAFGGGAGADLQLLAYPTDFPDSAARLPLREISARFFDFIATHADLYQGLRSYAEVGIVFHDNSREILGSHPEHHSETFALAKALAGCGVLWDVLSEKTVTPVNMARFKALIYHKVESIFEDEALALKSFMENGGMVIASGSKPGYSDQFGFFYEFSVGMFDEFFRLRAANPHSAWPPVPLSGSQVQTVSVGHGTFMDVPDGPLDIAQVIGWIEGHLAQAGPQRPLGVFPNLDGQALERLRVSAWVGHQKMVMHFVNYDVAVGPENAGQVQTLHSVAITVKLAGAWQPSTVNMYTPEALGFSGCVPLEILGNGIVRFTIPSLRIYEVASLH